MYYSLLVTLQLHYTQVVKKIPESMMEEVTKSSDVQLLAALETLHLVQNEGQLQSNTASLFLPVMEKIKG